MRVLLTSHRYPPDIGGIETISQLLAGYFADNGHEVIVVTGSRGANSGGTNSSVHVIRRPRPVQLFRLYGWSDVVFQNNISLQMLWPNLLRRRPLVIAIRTWVRRSDGRIVGRDRLKRAILKRAITIANSAEVAQDVPGVHHVVPNSYDDAVFGMTNDPASRQPRIAFVGRLVNDKGAHLLIEAHRRLVSRLGDVPMCVIGDGPEREALERQADEAGTAHLVEFLGRLDPRAVAHELNRATVLAVPSVWDEPFGIVALEGIACGCVVVASQGGGLAGAVGDCGVVVPNGDVGALEEALETALDSDQAAHYRRSMPEHAARHTRDTMARAYMDVIERAPRVRA